MKYIAIICTWMFIMNVTAKEKKAEREYSLVAFIPQAITENYAQNKRTQQGMPGIEILPSGRMFATYYAGHEVGVGGEGPGDFVILATSPDRGRTWKEIQVIPPIDPKTERAFDANVWLDPTGRLWWFWSQTKSYKRWDSSDGRQGIWVVVCDNPDTDNPVWSDPRRIGEGVMFNKPEVLSNGDWLFPVALWGNMDRFEPEYLEIVRSNILISKDKGKSFEFILGPEIPEGENEGVCEPMVIERKDKSWWMLLRTFGPVCEAVSTNNGKTWLNYQDSRIGGQVSRFAIRRLKSGRLLLINHELFHMPGEEKNRKAPRDRLSAWLSDDDGLTWYGRLRIDEREGVSYPDFVQDKDGSIYVTYDYNRREGNVLISRFTEADVKAGRMVTPGSFRQMVVSSLIDD